jgi:hypothetical protein
MLRRITFSRRVSDCEEINTTKFIHVPSHTPKRAEMILTKFRTWGPCTNLWKAMSVSNPASRPKPLHRFYESHMGRHGETPVLSHTDRMAANTASLRHKYSSQGWCRGIFASFGIRKQFDNWSDKLVNNKSATMTVNIHKAISTNYSSVECNFLYFGRQVPTFRRNMLPSSTSFESVLLKRRYLYMGLHGVTLQESRLLMREKKRKPGSKVDCKQQLIRH